MDEQEEQVAEPEARWALALRLELHGPGAPGPRGSSRRLVRGLSDLELESLNERLQRATEEFLAELDALDDSPGDGWVEELRDGSWAWRF